jgi:hypothetical protein
MSSIASAFRLPQFKMVDTRKATRSSQPEKRVRNPDTSKVGPDRSSSDQQLFEAVVKLQRTFPNIPLQGAKQVLSQCEMDVKQAVAILRSRQTNLVDNKAEASSLPPVRPPAVIKRPAPDFS